MTSKLFNTWRKNKTN